MPQDHGFMVPRHSFFTLMPTHGLITRAWYKAKDGGEHAEYFFMPFNDDYDGWQFASRVIVPDSYYQKQQITLKYIDVYVVYDRNFSVVVVASLY